MKANSLSNCSASAIQDAEERELLELSEQYAAAQLAIAGERAQYASAREQISALVHEVESLRSTNASLAQKANQNSDSLDEIAHLRHQINVEHSSCVSAQEQKQRSEHLNHQLQQQLQQLRAENSLLRQSVLEKETLLNSILASGSYRLSRKIASVLKRIRRSGR